MAFLGIQLVITMAMLSFLHKFTSKYSIARWILSRGLVRYLHPSEDQVKQMVNGMKNKRSKKEQKADKHQQLKEEQKRARSRKRGKSRGTGDDLKSDAEETKDPSTFIPRNANWTLEAGTVHRDDLALLPYYADYQWLIDFSFCALIVFIMTEVYYAILPNSPEFNLSLVWCVLVAAFAYKILASLTALYFRGGDEAIGERSVCITSACMFFLVSMVALIGNESFLDIGINDAYASFNESAYSYLMAHGVASTATGPTSKLLVKFWLALWCGFVGALFTFPGLRLAQMHKDSLKYSEGKRFTQFLLNTSFISPLFVLLLWIRPISRSYLTEKTWPNRGTIMSADSFETTRIVAVLVVAALRFAVMPKYLQAYLNLAPQRLSKLKKEAGKIKSDELRRMIAGVFYYLNVVTLQFIGPILMTVTNALLLKVLGDFAWTSYFSGPLSSPSPDAMANSDFTLTALRQVFTPIMFRGLLGFMTWWMSTVWFLTSLIGFGYHSYFST